MVTVNQLVDVVFWTTSRGPEVADSDGATILLLLLLLLLLPVSHTRQTLPSGPFEGLAHHIRSPAHCPSPSHSLEHKRAHPISLASIQILLDIADHDRLL